jgi:GDP-4-dehydro-6-deoxy-D-mannose reductase
MVAPLGLYSGQPLGRWAVTPSKKSLLLIGGAGFAGSHMARLMAADYQVFAYGRQVDVRDVNALKHAVSLSKPDLVVNFASITTVRESFSNPAAAYDITFKGMLNLLTVLKEAAFSGRILNVSSSEIYGHPHPEELPSTESSDLRPMSPYSVAKLAAEFLCYQWWQSEGMEIMTARPFTHIGPGQSDRFAISNFSRQIAEIMLGQREPVMHVGDLSTTRDFTDVRDTVRAYRSILELGESGEIYNVCSGVEISLREMLDRLIAKAGIAIQVETDVAMQRPSEQRRLLGSCAKLEKATHWQPSIDLEQTLTETLGDWLTVVQSRTL